MMSTWCSKHVEAWNKAYCKTKILCIKLVNYWDKYTEMRGQQNIKNLHHSLLSGLRPSRLSTITSAYLFSPYHSPCCSSYPAWFHLHNNIQWGIQIMTFFITQIQGRCSVWYFVTWCFWRRLVISSPPPARGLPLISCPQLHIQCSRRCCLYLEAVCFIRILQKCRTMVTRTHVHDFELRHVSAKNDSCCKQAGAQLSMIGTEELASGWRVWGVQKFLRHRVASRKMHFPSFRNQF